MSTAQAATPAARMDVLLLSAIVTSKTNPRTNFDPVKLKELEDSIREKGVLQPILVRTMEDGRKVELVAGERRVRAARAAGLTQIPAVIRELTDQEVLEIQVVENLQRDNLHPLEEAAGYQRLMGMKGYDVARIAEKIGRSAKYVYDRMKLVSLVKEAKDFFLAGTITAGHAILLARLKPEDQKRALETRDYHTGGLFRHSRTLFGPDGEPDREDNFTPVSVRELAAWIDENVKLEAPDVDQMVLPETAATLAEAAEEKVKVLRITHEMMTPAALKDGDGPKAILSRSWKRADGKHGSKTCASARLGMVVIGPARGEAFQVCVDKKKCTVHWKELVQAAKKSAAAANKAVAKGEDPAVARERARKAEEARRAEERERFHEARPAIQDALITAIAKAPAGAKSPLGAMVLEEILNQFNGPPKTLTPGKTAEDLVRHLGAIIMLDELEQDWNRDQLIKRAKTLGVDVAKILAAATPKSCRKCGCTEAAACPGGCAWVAGEKKPLCTACAPKVAKKRARA